MKTLSLPDGSLVRLVDVARARFEPHFRSSNGYYVDLDMRDGSTREDIQRVSRDAAEGRRNEIVLLMQEAWAEVDAYECGRQEATADARSSGYADGLEDGRREGHAWGRENGLREGIQHVVNYVQETREQFMRELDCVAELSPRRRRFFRDGIDVLTGIIRHFSEDGYEP
ncbi:MAG: hypothetical protein ACM3JG_02785 [Thiohalocapsa sp.]